MYIDGKKALIMIKDESLRHRLLNYLPRRYNLLTDSAVDILDVLQQVSSDEKYELVILDEAIVGLAATSHTLNNIKDLDHETNVLFLSSLKEFDDPHWLEQLDWLPLCTEEDYRVDRTMLYMRSRLAMHAPVMGANTMAEAYPIVCDQMTDTFKVDGAFIANLRLGVDPVNRGIIVGTDPPDSIEREEFKIEPSGLLRDLITYYKPVHCPDIHEMPAFASELEEKLQISCRSVLLVPMQLSGRCVGFIGMYMKKLPRLFSLPEIDLVQRLADTTAAVLITIFFRDYINVMIDKDDDSAFDDRGIRPIDE